MVIAYVPEQGRHGLRILPPLDINKLAQETGDLEEVFLLVYGPGATPTRPKDLRWSLAWRVSNGGWKHIHVTAENTLYDPQMPWRYVYWGPQNKTAELDNCKARRMSLGVMDVATRRRIKALAWEVGVAKPNRQWTGQHWIIALLHKLYENKVLTQAQWSKAIAQAPHRTC
ncbi:hypothetical protein K466DRAFT_501976 [Polyporus arcularius HHB13444]|uniref:Uncharacterized protein n=1 Tax=Polyporus arcularius HHB13444 TaxID=1314778 RepID=A0A5C3NVX7_9APHY|nr:hypothetical protein K466DRAFT_501976 [Polyporus arcularius HHB13444]